MFFDFLIFKHFFCQKQIDRFDCWGPDGRLDTKIDQFDLCHISMSYVVIWHKMSYYDISQLIFRYLLNDMEIREFRVYLEQYYCNPDQDRCPGQIVEWFPAMHRMAMEEWARRIKSKNLFPFFRFFIPADICNKKPECGATKPTEGPAPSKPGF